MFIRLINNSFLKSSSIHFPRVIRVQLYILELTITLGFSEVCELMSSLLSDIIVATSQRPRVVIS